MTVTIPLPALLLIACLACATTWLFAYLAFHPREDPAPERQRAPGHPSPRPGHAGYLPAWQGAADAGYELPRGPTVTGPMILWSQHHAYMAATEREIRQLTADAAERFGHL